MLCHTGDQLDKKNHSKNVYQHPKVSSELLWCCLRIFYFLLNFFFKWWSGLTYFNAWQGYEELPWLMCVDIWETLIFNFYSVYFEQLPGSDSDIQQKGAFLLWYSTKDSWVHVPSSKQGLGVGNGIYLYSLHRDYLDCVNTHIILLRVATKSFHLACAPSLWGGVQCASPVLL